MSFDFWPLLVALLEFFLLQGRNKILLTIVNPDPLNTPMFILASVQNGTAHIYLLAVRVLIGVVAGLGLLFTGNPLAVIFVTAVALYIFRVTPDKLGPAGRLSQTAATGGSRTIWY
jgi:hypothetical protein